MKDSADKRRNIPHMLDSERDRAADGCGYDSYLDLISRQLDLLRLTANRILYALCFLAGVLLAHFLG